uniref:Reverse transcriptase domain-containing protein n=1 Tax=Tanacetum cinerariifolium TaxID=118510 RepID=A0A699HAB3_TANCI|nr:hypothetical protein [Tanacetum cinerariifolium]
MTHEEVKELVARRVAEGMEARNGDGGNEENGNGNRNMNHGMNYGGFMPVARECTFQEFLKCKPHILSGTKGVVGLTRWFEKIETRTIGVDAAYAMKWAELIKLMTEVYCLRNEIQKMETELWNLTMKGNDLTAYTQRSAENKRRMESNLKDNRGQQPPFKRQNISRQNVARAYTTGNNEKRWYTGPHPFCNKCRYLHVGPCTVRYGNCKKVGHLIRDCTATVAPNTQRAPVGNQQGIVCYECERPRNFRMDFPKLRNQNRGNQTRNIIENKTGNQIGDNEATAKAYAIGGGGTNPDSNVVTGIIPLNNCYASMLFDSRTDRSFVSFTFSALLDVAPSTLDTSYAVELVDEKIS